MRRNFVLKYSMNTIIISPSIEDLSNTNVAKGRPRSSFGNIKKIYHCPMNFCKYSEEKSFNKIKLLKQHFTKVHKQKSFHCTKCGKSFPLEATLNKHNAICGTIYRCHCKAEYKAYEAYLTHVKRKHKETTMKYKDMMVCLKAHSMAIKFQSEFDDTIKVESIYVNDTKKVNCVKVKKQLSNSSKETQTGIKMCKILPNITMETTNVIQEKKTVSLQTTAADLMTIPNSELLASSVEQPKNDCMDERNVLSSSTQTLPINKDLGLNNNKHDLEMNVAPTVLPFEDHFDISSDDLTYLQIFNDNILFPDDPNFGNLLESNCMRSYGTQTEIDIFDSNSLLENSDTNFVLCADSETQTRFDDIFDNAYNNTYSKTCDNLFSDLFVDIETQTCWPFDNDLSI